MPTPYEVIEAARKRVLEQAEQAEKDMRDLERIVNKYKLLVVAPDSYTPPSNEGIKRSFFSRAQEEGEAIIRAAGHPLSISEVLQIMLDRGIEIGAQNQNPTGALTTCLIKNPRLRYIPKVGWWLRNVSWPPKPEEIGLIFNPLPEATEEAGSRRRRRTPEKERLYQELRKLLEGKTEPTPFREIYDHIKGLNIPIGGKNDKQNLSAFMTSIHEFRTHGAEGRAGWTFAPDASWNVVEGFAGETRKLPKYLRTPAKQRLFEAIRGILKDQPERIPGNDLFQRLKQLGVEIGAPGTDEWQYFRSYMSTVPCFQGQRDGWKYRLELDPSLDNVDQS